MFGISFASNWLLGRRPRKPARYRPVLHALEHRCLLSTFNEFPLPDLPRPHFGTDRILLDGITAGPDGTVWFTDTDAGAIGSITPNGSFTEFVQDHTFPNASFVQGIATGADGNLWFGGLLNVTGPRIGRITPDGTATRFPIPFFDVPGTDEQEQNVSGLTAGPDGNVWYNESVYPGFQAIGRVTPDGQAAALYLSPTSNAFGTGGITTGPDGKVWFITGNRGELGRITPDGQTTLLPTPASQDLFTPKATLTVGPDGNLWATGVQADPHTGHDIAASIDRITLDGQFTEFPLPLANLPGSITAGPDGNLWFTEPGANQIGMITPDGQITEYPVPTANSHPEFITTGPDGNLWFTEPGSVQIGEFVLGDGGPGAGAAPAASAPLAQAVRSAAVAALFASAQPEPLGQVVVNQQPALVAVDAAFAASRPEVVTAPPAKQAVADAGTMRQRHHEDRAGAADAAGLADPLAAGLAQTV
jgi:virginiamycin B lyase